MVANGSKNRDKSGGHSTENDQLIDKIGNLEGDKEGFIGLFGENVAKKLTNEDFFAEKTGKRSNDVGNSDDKGG